METHQCSYIQINVNASHNIFTPTRHRRSWLGYLGTASSAETWLNSITDWTKLTQWLRCSDNGGGTRWWWWWWGPQITHLPENEGWGGARVELRFWKEMLGSCWGRKTHRAKKGKKEKREIRKVHCGLFGQRLAFGRWNDRVEKPPTLQRQGAFFIGMYIPDIC